jgi:hypothetical protein
MSGAGPAGVPSLPYTPCPLPGELLSSWLKRIAAEFRVSLAHLAHHLGLSASTTRGIDTGLEEADIRSIAAATHCSASQIRLMVHSPLSASVRSLVARQGPIQFCAVCRARHSATTGGSVAIKAWFEYWQIECAQCRVPFESMGRPNLRRCNPAREDPEWFSRLLPAAKSGGARLANFARRPLGVAVTPTAVLNLMSMRLSVKPRASEVGCDDPYMDWGNSHCIAELFVPGLRERISQDLIPKTWTTNAPVRLVAARAILLAAMEAFLEDACQAFRRVTNVASGATTATLNRWFVRLPPHSRQLLHGPGYPSRAVSHLLLL